SVSGHIPAENLFWYLIVLYPVNMYFQSFGAVAVVKCNAPWFHVRERGVFGAIFGILIALGLYIAFDWTAYILDGLKLPVGWAFFTPAAALALMFIVGWFVVRNRPSEAGQEDIDVGDGLSPGDNKPDPPIVVLRMMLNNKIIMTIACIEFCSGFLRQSNMQLYRPIAKAIGSANNFVYENWGLMLCCAGILGGVFAGTISDHFFKSRRGPVAAILYAGLLLTGVAMCFLLGSPALAWLVLSMSLCVIGVHGMLSGTASMDFGGTKNTGVAVGLIDGFVYLGTGLQSVLYAITLPEVKATGSNNPSAWWFWPVAMVPMALIGLYLAYKIRNVSVKKN
ncbi:MAG: MFS transporter, partial [Patescibacteria group bacterium]